MRNLLWALGIGMLSLSTLAQPMSWATVDPPPNPYGWHNTTVTVILQASGGQNCAFATSWTAEPLHANFPRSHFPSPPKESIPLSTGLRTTRARSRPIR